MKRIISASLVCLLLVGMLFALTSCEKKLSGTYEYTEDGATASLTFTKDGKVTTKTTYEGETVFESDGTYVIEEKDDGSYTITVTFTEDGESETETMPIVIEKDSIKLGTGEDAIEYKKK